MQKIAIVGASLIGRAWAMVFACAAHPVGLYDAAAAALAANLAPSMPGADASADRNEIRTHVDIGVRVASLSPPGSCNDHALRWL